MGECDHFQTYHKLVHSLAGHISDKLFYLLKGMVISIHSNEPLKKLQGCFNPNLGQIWTNPTVGLKFSFKNLTQQLGMSIFDPNLECNLQEKWSRTQVGLLVTEPNILQSNSLYTICNSKSNTFLFYPEKLKTSFLGLELATDKNQVEKQMEDNQYWGYP